MRTKPFVCLLAAAAIISCGPYYEPPAPVPTRPATELDVSFSKAWDAVIDVLASLNIPVDVLDRSSGLLIPAGSVTLGTREIALQFARCGLDRQYGEIIPGSARYNIVVRGDSVRSHVLVRAFFYPTENPVNAECVSTGKWETRVEELIKSHVKP